jgi:hypothetical protein
VKIKSKKLKRKQAPAKDEFLDKSTAKLEKAIERKLSENKSGIVA